MSEKTKLNLSIEEETKKQAKAFIDYRIEISKGETN